MTAPLPNLSKEPESTFYDTQNSGPGAVWFGPDFWDKLRDPLAGGAPWMSGPWCTLKSLLWTTPPETPAQVLAALNNTNVSIDVPGGALSRPEADGIVLSADELRGLSIRLESADELNDLAAQRKRIHGADTPITVMLRIAPVGPPVSRDQFVRPLLKTANAGWEPIIGRCPECDQNDARTAIVLEPDSARPGQDRLRCVDCGRTWPLWGFPVRGEQP